MGGGGVLIFLILAYLWMMSPLLLIVPAVLFVILAIAKWTSIEPCPNCGSRPQGFRHPRIDGQRDLRYSVNPIVCRACGAVKRPPSTAASD